TLLYPRSTLLVLSLAPFLCTHSAPTEIYTLSLHDALPIFPNPAPRRLRVRLRYRSGSVTQRREPRLLHPVRSRTDLFHTEPVAGAARRHRYCIHGTSHCSH